VNVIRSGGTNGLVTVTASAHDDGAKAGEDYTAVTTNLVFAPGVVKAVLVVPLIDDGAVETNEGILLSLTEPTGGATVGLIPSELLWLISDDVGGTVEFARTNFVVSEAERYPEITVIRAGGLAGGASVDFFTSDLTASNSVDYLATTQPLFFDVGVTSIVVRAQSSSATVSRMGTGWPDCTWAIRLRVSCWGHG